MRNSANNSMAVKSAKNIQIIVKENDLAISKDIANCSCVDLIAATHDIVSKIYDKQTFAKAIKRINSGEKSKSAKGGKNIQIIVKENDLTISKEMMNCLCVDLLKATKDIASKLFDKQTVTKANEKFNSDDDGKTKTRSKSKAKAKSKNEEIVEVKIAA